MNDKKRLQIHFELESEYYKTFTELAEGLGETPSALAHRVVRNFIISDRDEKFRWLTIQIKIALGGEKQNGSD